MLRQKGQREDWATRFRRPQSRRAKHLRLRADARESTITGYVGEAKEEAEGTGVTRARLSSGCGKVRRACYLAFSFSHADDSKKFVLQLLVDFKVAIARCSILHYTSGARPSSFNR